MNSRFNFAHHTTQFGDVISGHYHTENNHLTSAYYDCVQAAIKDVASKDMMFNFERSALEGRDAYIVIAIDTSRKVVGGLHWNIEPSGQMMIRAVVVDAIARGRKIGQALVAHSVIQAENLFGNAQNPICAIRVLADGTENVRSAKTFEHMGFWSEKCMHQKTLVGDHSIVIYLTMLRSTQMVKISFGINKCFHRL